jgi:hypothetical protein
MTEPQETKDLDTWLAELRVVVSSDVVLPDPETWTILDRAALSEVTIETLRAAHFVLTMAQIIYTFAQADAPSLTVDFHSAASELVWLIRGLEGGNDDN